MFIVLLMSRTDCPCWRDYRLKRVQCHSYAENNAIKDHQMRVQHFVKILEAWEIRFIDDFRCTRVYCHVEHSSAFGNVLMLAFPSFFPVFLVPFSPLILLVFIRGPLRLRRGIGRDGWIIVSKNNPRTLITDQKISVTKLKRKIVLFSTTVPSDLM